MTADEQKRFAAIVHIVHEYANFVSSAEMVLSGRYADGVAFRPPVNTHVSHAFYLNCRKLADFFQNKRDRDGDDVVAEHYVSGFNTQLPVCDSWRAAINKQLAHVTYSRDTSSREINAAACKELYDELRDAWRRFRSRLRGSVYETEFKNQITKRKERYPNGTPSEFGSYNLD